jgi:hypothetical protein
MCFIMSGLTAFSRAASMPESIALTHLCGRVRCDGCGTLLCSPDCVRAVLTLFFRGITATVPSRSSFVWKGDANNYLTIFVSVGRLVTDVQVREVYQAAWSGESSGKLVNLGETWWKPSIVSDNQAFHSLIIKPFDNQTVSLPWLSQISGTSENHPERLDSDNQINISRLICCLGCSISLKQSGRSRRESRMKERKNESTQKCPCRYTHTQQYTKTHTKERDTDRKGQTGVKAYRHMSLSPSFRVKISFKGVVVHRGNQGQSRLRAACSSPSDSLSSSLHSRDTYPTSIRRLKKNCTQNPQHSSVQSHFSSPTSYPPDPDKRRNATPYGWGPRVRSLEWYTSEEFESWSGKQVEKARNILHLQVK